MPWRSLSEVPDSVKKHKGIPLTLGQANRWAEFYDAIRASGASESSAAAIAWSQWGKEYKKSDDGKRWVKK